MRDAGHPVDLCDRVTDLAVGALLSPSGVQEMRGLAAILLWGLVTVGCATVGHTATTTGPTATNPCLSGGSCPPAGFQEVNRAKPAVR